jgi:hypothetical protein
MDIRTIELLIADEGIYICVCMQMSNGSVVGPGQVLMSVVVLLLLLNLPYAYHTFSWRRGKRGRPPGKSPSLISTDRKESLFSRI